MITTAYPALNLPRVGPINPSVAIYRLRDAAAEKDNNNAAAPR